MNKTLLTLLTAASLGCGNPVTHDKEFRSNIDLPVTQVARDMGQDIRNRNFGDAAHRPVEHSYSLGRVSESQKRMYRAGAAEDANDIMNYTKSCYNDTDMEHCLPSLAEYLVRWER